MARQDHHTVAEEEYPFMEAMIEGAGEPFPVIRARQVRPPYVPHEERAPVKTAVASSSEPL